MKGADAQEKLVYQIIKEAHNKGEHSYKEHIITLFVESVSTVNFSNSITWLSVSCGNDVMHLILIKFLCMFAC